MGGKDTPRIAGPNFFVVGAAKAGTTALYHHLNRHPQIYMSPVKEPNHFASDIDVDRLRATRRLGPISDLGRYLDGSMDRRYHMAYVTDREDYLKLFKNVSGEIAAGEASASYLYSKQAAANIHAWSAKARIVIMLRNPVDRVFSHYVMNLKRAVTAQSFVDAVRADGEHPEWGWGMRELYVELGMYHDQVKRFLDVFPSRSVKVYLYDDLINDPETLVRDLYAFLGVDPGHGIDITSRHNVGRTPRFKRFNHLLYRLGLYRFVRLRLPPGAKNRIKPLLFSREVGVSMTEEERSYFRDLYAPDIERLSRLLQRDLKFWLQT